HGSLPPRAHPTPGSRGAPRLDRPPRSAESRPMTPAPPEPVYEVVWPLAPSAAAPAALAPRPPDLAGRTIGELWDSLFRGEVIFPLLREALGIIVAGDPGRNQSKGYCNNRIQG